MISALLLASLCLAACRGRNPDAVQEGAHAEARYLVLHKLASSVGFYSAEGKLVDEIPVGRYPHEMIFSGDGRYAYVSDYGALGVEEEAKGGNTVSIIDIPGRRRTGVIDLGRFRRPHGLDLDPATGRLLISTENPNRLLVVDTANRGVLREFETGGLASHMVTTSPDGSKAFVSNIVSSNVSMIDLNTASAVLIPVGRRPEGSAITRDGRTLHVANRESDRISIIDTEKAAVVGEIRTGRGPNRVRLVEGDRSLVYSLVHDRGVGFADTVTRSETHRISLDGSPVSLQVSHDRLWAFTAAQNEDSLYVISVPERSVTARFKTALGAGPDPMLEIPRARR